MARQSLLLAGDSDPPLYTGNIEADIRTMNKKSAEELGGKLSHPSKMDVISWGISAARCRLGAVLAQQEGTVCSECYALGGTFNFRNVAKVMEDNYQKLWNVQWTPALAALFRWEGSPRARLFVSGDIQGVHHLLNLIQIAQAVRDTIFWMPTREIATLEEVQRRLVKACLAWPPNLIPRVSGNLVGGRAPRGFRYTSTVVTQANADTCPSSVKGGNCADHHCVRCWQEEGNIAYLLH